MRLMVGLSLALAVLTAACGGGAAPTAAVSASPKASPSAPAVVTAASPPPRDPCSHAQAAVAVTLPVTDFGRMVADWQHCQVFVSSPGSNSIVAVDYSGNVIKVIPSEYGADAMVIDGSTLYVVLTLTGAIDEIDTTSLTKIKTLATGLVKPRDLAFAGGRLWTTSGTCSQWTMQLASVDPASGKVTLFDADRSTNLGYCAGFATASKSGKLLVAWDSGLSPGSITVMDVSSGRPMIMFSRREENLGNLTDGAITPGGDKLITASGSPYEFDEWTLDGIAQDGVIYPGSPYPNSVAISGVRNGLIATGVIKSTGDSVAEYELGKPAPIATMLTMGSDRNLLYPRGLAFSGDGALVFAVTGFALDGSAVSVTLNVLPGPTLP